MVRRAMAISRQTQGLIFKQVIEIPDFGQELPCKRFAPLCCPTIIGLTVNRFCIKDVLEGVTELPFQTMELLPCKSRHGY
jgi:hypothetical protein